MINQKQTSCRGCSTIHGYLPLLGAQAILQSDNGTECKAHVISEIKDFCPVWVTIHGKARHLQSQGSVQRSNGDMKCISVAWLADNDTHDWITGIKCVQFQKKSANHSGMKRCPDSALFGEEVRVGLIFSATHRKCSITWTVKKTSWL